MVPLERSEALVPPQRPRENHRFAPAVRRRRQRNQPEREEFIRAEPFLVHAAKVDHEITDRQPPVARRSRGRRRSPRRHRSASQRQPQSPISCSPSRPRPSITKGNAVPSFRPASPVMLKRSRSVSRCALELHVGCKHRIGRRENRSEQNCGSHGQPETINSDERNQADGDRHRNKCQPQRYLPRALSRSGTRSFRPA